MQASTFFFPYTHNIDILNIKKTISNMLCLHEHLSSSYLHLQCYALLPLWDLIQKIFRNFDLNSLSNLMGQVIRACGSSVCTNSVLPGPEAGLTITEQ